MNKTYSRPELYYKRWITADIQAASVDHTVVILTGARQVGKSTLLLNEPPFRDWPFQTLDDFDTLRQARESPAALWAGTNEVVLDEVQKLPALLSAVKLAVDREPRRRFVLSGSANLLLMHQVSESLAGRAVYFVLDPLTLGEIHQAPPPDLLARALAGDWPGDGSLSASPPDAAPILLRGLMPPLQTFASSEAWVRWWDGYVTTYLERDLRQVSQIEALVDFRRLMDLTALRAGQLLNQSELARDAGLSQPTAHRYLTLLEATHLFERLPAYAASGSTRLVKSPKAFWNDPGLAVFLSGYYDADSLRQAREYGAYFENLIYHHLRVLAALMTPRARLYYWRTRSGDEVDFVIEHGRRLIAVEAKLTARPAYSDADGLRAFLSKHPKAAGGLVLHAGSEIRRLDHNIVALPWTLITG